MAWLWKRGALPPFQAGWGGGGGGGVTLVPPPYFCHLYPDSCRYSYLQEKLIYVVATFT